MRAAQAERRMSILTHPKSPGANTRNRDTVEEQYERDMGAFDRTARKYREKQGEQYHHHRVGGCLLLGGGGM
jgi:hypothetical protein